MSRSGDVPDDSSDADIGADGCFFEEEGFVTRFFLRLEPFLAHTIVEELGLWRGDTHGWELGRMRRVSGDTKASHALAWFGDGISTVEEEEDG